MLTFLPLLLIPLAARALWAWGFRGVAWILPCALGLHWLVRRGHGSELPVVVASALLGLASLYYFMRRNITPIATDGDDAAGDSRHEQGTLGEPLANSVLIPQRRELNSAALDGSPPGEWSRMIDAKLDTPVYPFANAATAHHHPPTQENPTREHPTQEHPTQGQPNQGQPRVAATNGLLAERVTTPGGHALLRDLPRSTTPHTSPDSSALAGAPTAPIGGNGTSSSTAPEGSHRAGPLRYESLLDAIDAAASGVQSSTIVTDLRSRDEHLHLLQDSDCSAAARGRARPAARRPWGAKHVDGLVLEFSGVAPGDATVLAVLAEIPEGAAPVVLSNTLVLIPINLPAVKRLDSRLAPKARWVAREVFVPLSHVVGESAGIGRGDEILASIQR